jgi:hypothetical protein
MNYGLAEALRLIKVIGGFAENSGYAYTWDKKYNCYREWLSRTDGTWYESEIVNEIFLEFILSNNWKVLTELPGEQLLSTAN